MSCPIVNKTATPDGVEKIQRRVNKKLFMRSTGETDIKKAKAKRDEILAPFLAGREVDVLRNVSARIEGRTAEIEVFHIQAEDGHLIRVFRGGSRSSSSPQADAIVMGSAFYGSDDYAAVVKAVRENTKDA